MKKSLFFVGSYTIDSNSEGIYSIALDEDTGKMAITHITENCENPSYLAIYKDVLYVANELSNKAYLSAYKIYNDGKLSLLDKIDIPGAGACYLAIWNNGNFLSGANYTSGNIFTCALNKDGTFKKIVDIFQNHGNSVDKSRQEHSHMHAITPNQNSNYWLASDLGTDELFYYRANKDKGYLNLLEKKSVAPGSGPRHFAFNKETTYGYLTNELNNTISVYQLTDDSINCIQSIPATNLTTLNETNYPSHLVLQDKESILYVSNRGTNTIDLFKIKEDGKLTYYQNSPCYGEYPRHFDFSPSKKYIVIANQKSGDIVCCHLNKDGTIGKCTDKITIPKAINICFSK